MAAMPPVHEQMHRQTGEQQQERQRAQQVGAMFGKQIKSGNRQKCNENPVVSPWGAMCALPGMVAMFHHVLLPEKICAHKTSFHIFTRFSLSALTITDTELKLIAAAAMMGESSKPKNGYSTPAAMGMPSTL